MDLGIYINFLQIIQLMLTGELRFIMNGNEWTMCYKVMAILEERHQERGGTLEDVSGNRWWMVEVKEDTRP